MIYIFDSNVLIDLFKNYYRNRFPSLWQKFDCYVSTGKIISVHEVLNEIGDREDELAEWAKKNKNIFVHPSHDELLFITQIFNVNHFQSLVRTEERLKGKPVADPFLIAKAKISNGYVVTGEVLKPNAAKIPNVCQHFGIKSLNLEEFMEQENWTF